MADRAPELLSGVTPSSRRLLRPEPCGPRRRLLRLRTRPHGPRSSFHDVLYVVFFLRSTSAVGQRLPPPCPVSLDLVRLQQHPHGEQPLLPATPRRIALIPSL